jgi:hypothetical protein
MRLARIEPAKEGIGDLVARSPCMSPDQFCLEGFKEGLNGGIVVAVTSATFDSRGNNIDCPCRCGECSLAVGFEGLRRYSRPVVPGHVSGGC